MLLYRAAHFFVRCLAVSYTHLAAHLSGAVQVAVLVQKPGQRVQLVPHFAAINLVQHRQQREDVYKRQIMEPMAKIKL